MYLLRFRKQKCKARIWFGILLAALLLVGCGKKVMPKLSEEELAAMQYIEKTEVEDYYGDGASYDVYAPKGSDKTDGFVYYYGHGITYSASATNLSYNLLLYGYMKDLVQDTAEVWQDENFGNADNVKFSRMKKNGDNRYQFISATKKNDFEGTTFEARAFFYLDVKADGAGVLWDLELEEGNVDEETLVILDELAACYGVDLDEIKTAVEEWIEAERKHAEERQDIYEPEEGEPVLEEVEGYQYMGLTTLTEDDGEIECPVMVPKGWSVDIWDDRVSSYVHGVSVDGSLGRISSQSLMKRVEWEIDISYDGYRKREDTYRNVRKTNMMPISGYEEAFYAAISYEELDSYTQEYFPYTRVWCFIKVSDDHMLDYEIKLFYDDYDASTNAVIKELETAYGIDLSEYYNEEEN